MLLGTAFAQWAVPFINCGVNLPVTISSVIVEENFNDEIPSLKFNVQGTTTIPLTGGNSLVTGSILSYQVYTNANSPDNLCTILGGCPKSTGAIHATWTTKISELKSIWGVDLLGQMVWKDTDGKEIGCVSLKIGIFNGLDAISNAVIGTFIIGGSLVALTSSGTMYVLGSKGGTTALQGYY